MEYNGKEIKFSYNVLAMKELAKICPGRNIKHLDTLLQVDDTVKEYENAQDIIIALNRGYEMAAHFNSPEYKPQPVSREFLDCLDDAELADLLAEALQAIGKKANIETAPETGKNVESPSN